jgi:hypothetical protein
MAALNKRAPDAFPGGELHTRYMEMSKADWADAFADLFRQVYGEAQTPETILADARRRDNLRRAANGEPLHRDTEEAGLKAERAEMLRRARETLGAAFRAYNQACYDLRQGRPSGDVRALEAGWQRAKDAVHALEDAWRADGLGRLPSWKR